jgi:hypothetical protein
MAKAPEDEDVSLGNNTLRLDFPRGGASVPVAHKAMAAPDKSVAALT